MTSLKSFLTESKQSLINIGFPEIAASIFQEKFGRNTNLIGKWFKEYETEGRGQEVTPDWWSQTQRGFGRISLADLTELYPKAALVIRGKNSVENYNALRTHYGLEPMAAEDVNERHLRFIRIDIENLLDKSLFFSRNIIKAILSGKLKDLKPYKDLTYQDANRKFESKTIFDDKKPIKVYPNGWKWIDAGKKCDIVAGQMKNCGSVGVMSMDRDATMMTLFDPNNVAHVVVTYSPNEQRLSGDEGQASSAVKDEYADYVLDLANVLGATIDDGTKSYYIKMKSTLGSNLQSLSTVPGSNNYNHYYILQMADGQQYYTDSFSAISKTDVEKIAVDKKIKTLFDKLIYVFGHYNKENILNRYPDIRYLRLRELAPKTELREVLKTMVRTAISEFRVRP